MSDNSSTSASQTFRTLEDTNSVKWPAQALAYPTTISAGANVLQLVDATHGLPVNLITGTTTQLVSNAGVFVVQATCTNAGVFAVQAAQSGTWNVTNISGTISLPTGAATAAKQPALGTAGTASSDVLTVQGIASMTALKVDGSAVTQPVSGTVTANAGSGTFTISGAVTNAGTFAVQAAQSGTWTVQPGNTANTTAWKVDGSAVTQPVSIASVPSHAVTNAGTFAVQAVCTNAGTFAVQAVCTNAGTFATQATLQAGTALIGQVSASPESDTIYGTTTARTPKFAKISAASSGENSLVALVSAKKIRVHSIFLTATGTANTIYFKDAASGTAIFADSTNSIPLDKTGAAGSAGFALGFNPVGWFQSASGGALILNLSAAQGVAGGLTYTEV